MAIKTLGIRNFWIRLVKFNYPTYLSSNWEQQNRHENNILYVDLWYAIAVYLLTI